MDQWFCRLTRPEFLAGFAALDHRPNICLQCWPVVEGPRSSQGLGLAAVAFVKLLQRALGCPRRHVDFIAIHQQYPVISD